jgi:phage shock protein C
MQVNHRLYRCRHDRRLAGVSSGLAEFFDLDPTLIRILWFLSIFFTGGLSILLYVALALIVPNEPVNEAEVAEALALTESGHRHVARGDTSGRWVTFFGVVLILFGGLALVDALLPSWVDAWRYLSPAFFVGLGALLIFFAVRRNPTASIESPES